MHSPAAIGRPHGGQTQKDHAAGRESEGGDGGGGPRPVFPKSYTATKRFANRIAQGSKISKGGDACCDKEDPVCAVQMQHATSTEYHDAEGKRVKPETARSERRDCRGAVF